MKQFVFATGNAHKIYEIQTVLPAHLSILSLRDIGCFEELPETHNTIEENSMEKALYIYQKYGYPCFAEDSGLEVMALNGEPGVNSAHYSGTRDADANIRLLLLNMRNEVNRKAQFKTVFTLICPELTDQYFGIVTGKITETPRGTNGFGYDPVFIADGFGLTFAEMPSEQKTAISHRTKAFQSMTNAIVKLF
jgi:XTP/dITP diphosphohydrolase